MASGPGGMSSNRADAPPPDARFERIREESRQEQREQKVAGTVIRGTARGLPYPRQVEPLDAAGGPGDALQLQESGAVERPLDAAARDDRAEWQGEIGGLHDAARPPLRRQVCGGGIMARGKAWPDQFARTGRSLFGEQDARGRLGKPRFPGSVVVQIEPQLRAGQARFQGDAGRRLLAPEPAGERLDKVRVMI